MMKNSNFKMSKSVRSFLVVVVLAFCFTHLYFNAPVLKRMGTPLMNMTFSKTRNSLGVITIPTLLDASTKRKTFDTTSLKTDKENQEEGDSSDGYYNNSSIDIAQTEANVDKKSLYDENHKFSLQHNGMIISGREKSPSYCGVSYSDSMDLLAKAPIKPLPEFKNPCWYEGSVFRCFPYFFLSGFPKCGTSDIYNRIRQHPQYVQSTSKEYQWLSKSRFYKHITLSDYLENYYRKASNSILMDTSAKSRPHNTTLHSALITGDSSATYIFDNDFWMLLPGNRNQTEPIYTNPHYIYHLYPQAKIIVSVRNPIERLWSDFLYSSVSKTQMTADSFHQVVTQAVKMYQDCFNKRSVRTCIYDRKLYILSTTNLNPSIVTSPTWKCPQWFQTNVHLRLGLYSLYIKEYFEVFPRDQIHVLRLEDFSSNMKESLQRIFDFLGLERLSDQKMQEISQLARSNTRATGKKVIGSMKEETRRLLFNFYKPFNEELALLLNDQRFNYNIR